MPTSSPPSRSPFSELRPPNPPPLARQHFKSALDEAQDDSDRVLLDLRALSFIDCACVAGLFAAARRGRREGAELILLGPRGQVRQMLDLVGSPTDVTLLGQGDQHRPREPVAA
jgi:ABC-type transporter Mla MlaB component